MLGEARSGHLRLAELVAAVSLGIDLGFGQPMEHVLRQCLIALRLAERLDQGEGTQTVVYDGSWVSIIATFSLRFSTK
jgi:hypothetical protein